MIIGITGGIASGKSTFSHYLEKQGFKVIDADKLAYDALTIDEECIQKVMDLFNCMDDNGKIDRSKLGNIIFNDKEAQKKLENIVHPYVICRLEEAVKTSHNDYLFLDIPLLYEAHLEYLCDMIVVVYVDEMTQLERLQARNHLTLLEAQARIDSQMSLKEKRKKADYIIDNNGNQENLNEQIEIFIEKIKGVK